MQTPLPVKLCESSVHMRPHGPAEFTQLDFNRVVMGEATFVWDPGLVGIYGGEGFEEVSPDQPGERHLDSNEVLYLISGAMSVRLEGDAGTPTDIPLQPDEAVIVPPRDLAPTHRGRTELVPLVRFGTNRAAEAIVTYQRRLKCRSLAVDRPGRRSR